MLNPEECNLNIEVKGICTKSYIDELIKKSSIRKMKMSQRLRECFRGGKLETIKED